MILFRKGLVGILTSRWLLGLSVLLFGVLVGFFFGANYGFVVGAYTSDSKLFVDKQLRPVKLECRFLDYRGSQVHKIEIAWDWAINAFTYREYKSEKKIYDHDTVVEFSSCTFAPVFSEVDFLGRKEWVAEIADAPFRER